VCVASVTQDKMRMRRIILSPVACPALQYFFTLTHKWHDFRKTKLLSIKLVFLFPLQFMFAIVLILKKTERDIVIYVRRS